jgi:hypothetical protein
MRTHVSDINVLLISEWIDLFFLCFLLFPKIFLLLELMSHNHSFKWHSTVAINAAIRVKQNLLFWSIKHYIRFGCEYLAIVTELITTLQQTICLYSRDSREMYSYAYKEYSYAYKENRIVNRNGEDTLLRTLEAQTMFYPPALIIIAAICMLPAFFTESNCYLLRN